MNTNSHHTYQLFIQAARIAELENELAALREENRHLHDSMLMSGKGQGNGGTKYVGSVYRDHFHRPHCKWMKEVSPHNLVTWHSHEAAVRAGRKPCKTCRS